MRTLRPFVFVLLALPALAGPRFTAAERQTLAKPWDGERCKAFALKASGLTLEVPASGIVIRARRLEPADPETQISERLALLDASGTVLLTVDVWRNPARLALSAWFDKHQAHLRQAGATVSEVRAGKSGSPAIQVCVAAGPQTLAQERLIVSLGPHVVRLTCPDTEDPFAVNLYRRARSTLVRR